MAPFFSSLVKTLAVHSLTLTHSDGRKGRVPNSVRWLIRKKQKGNEKEVGGGGNPRAYTHSREEKHEQQWRLNAFSLLWLLPLFFFFFASRVSLTMYTHTHTHASRKEMALYRAAQNRHVAIASNDENEQSLF